MDEQDFSEIFEPLPEAAETPQPEVQQPAEVKPEPSAEQQPQPEVAPQPTPEAAPETPEERDRTVPLATFLDQRDELRQLRQWKQQQEAERQQSAGRPNPLDDPEGFANWQTSQVEQRLVAERMAMSDMFARQQHGAEAVEKAVTWAQTRAQQDPAFAMSYMREQNPIDWIVRQHKREDLLSQIGDDPDSWVKRRFAELNPSVAQADAAQAAPSPPAAPPVKVPRSLATQGSGPSDVRDVAAGPVAAVDAVFPQ